MWKFSWKLKLKKYLKIFFERGGLLDPQKLRPQCFSQWILTKQGTSSASWEISEYICLYCPETVVNTLSLYVTTRVCRQVSGGCILLFERHSLSLGSLLPRTHKHSSKPLLPSKCGSHACKHTFQPGFMVTKVWWCQNFSGVKFS